MEKGNYGLYESFYGLEVTVPKTHHKNAERSSDFDFLSGINATVSEWIRLLNYWKKILSGNGKLGSMPTRL